MVPQLLINVATTAAETTSRERRIVMVADLIQHRGDWGDGFVTVTGNRCNDRRRPSPYTRSGAGMPRHERQSARVARVAATSRRRNARRLGSCSRTIASVCS